MMIWSAIAYEPGQNERSSSTSDSESESVLSRAFSTETRDEVRRAGRQTLTAGGEMTVCGGNNPKRQPGTKLQPNKNKQNSRVVFLFGPDRLSFDFFRSLLTSCPFSHRLQLVFTRLIQPFQNAPTVARQDSHPGGRPRRTMWRQPHLLTMRNICRPPSPYHSLHRWLGQITEPMLYYTSDTDSRLVCTQLVRGVRRASENVRFHPVRYLLLSLARVLTFPTSLLRR